MYSECQRSCSMNKIHNKRVKNRKTKKGRGLVNSLINKLPVELHLPGYQYCGPGTKLIKRLNRGDPGINQLDKACKEHDIAYNINKDQEKRNIADKILAGKAWQRFKSSDANLSEKANSLLVSALMTTKSKLGMGMNRKKSKKMKTGTKKCAKKKNHISFGSAIKAARKVLNTKKPNSLNESIKVALATAKNILKSKKKIKLPRVIPVPKIGGFLPFLIPLFAGLSAVGALSGGAAGIAKAVIAAKDAKKQLEESKRHNETMESIAMGRGLYLSPYRKGLGLYLKPNTPKNF